MRKLHIKLSRKTGSQLSISECLGFASLNNNNRYIYGSSYSFTKFRRNNHNFFLFIVYVIFAICLYYLYRRQNSKFQPHESPDQQNQLFRPPVVLAVPKPELLKILNFTADQIKIEPLILITSKSKNSLQTNENIEIKKEIHSKGNEGSSIDDVLKEQVALLSLPQDEDESDCIPKNLQYLATKYTRKLCKLNKRNLRDNLNIKGMTCQYPLLNPFDPDVNAFLGKHSRGRTCQMSPQFSNTPQIFTTDFEFNLITQLPPIQFGYSNCCYKNFYRVHGDDFETDTSKDCVPIVKPQQKIPREHEFIKIFCNQTPKTTTQSNSSSKSATNETSQKMVDMFAFTPTKSDVESRVENLVQNNKVKNVEETLNVVILGLDSMSHMNFIRTMPKSYEYIIEDMKGLGLYGYNKVGKNTLANVIPILTGLHPEQMTTVHPKCKIEDGPFDDCPFLWKEFVSSGYRTVYGEDEEFVSMFNYDKNGFKSPPTDYYLRPFIMESDKIYYWKTKGPKGPLVFPCYAGARLNFQYILDYMRSTAQAMGRDKRYFELLWANSLSHSHLHWPVAGDANLLESLTWFKNSNPNVLNNTLLIVMSDHGLRYGGIRNTFQGRAEHRMPFAFFIFPHWFKNKYPRALENFKRNKYRLTTPFDVHYTLRDLLNLEQIENLSIEMRSKRVQDDLVKNVLSISNSSQSDARYGISLFLPIPETRVCREAGVSDYYCICHHVHPLNNFKEDPLVHLLAKHLVNIINYNLETYVECPKLKLDTILGAEIVVVPSPDLKAVGEENLDDAVIKSDELTELLAQEAVESKVFTVSIMTGPGGASFDTQFIVNTRLNMTTLKGDISRTDRYDEQRQCVSTVKENYLKALCDCVD